MEGVVSNPDMVINATNEIASVREQLACAIADRLIDFENRPDRDVLCLDANRAGVLAVEAIWPLIAARVAAEPIDGLSQVRLALDEFDGDLLAVGDRFAEGGRYVQMFVPRAKSARWNYLDWLDAYERLAKSWRGRAARDDWS